MNNQIYTDINEIKYTEGEENKNKKRILKAINLIDDFVTKFISKIEYFKLTLESQLNQQQLTLINAPLLIKNNDNSEKDNKKEKTKENENDEKNVINNEGIKNNTEDEYLNKFISTKQFYKKALYLLYLTTEDKLQIEQLIKSDSNSNISFDNNKIPNQISCIKEIPTKNFINHISYIKSQDLISLGMYNFFDGSSIDLYSLDLKIKLSIKKLGSTLYELKSGDLVTCSYNTINIIKLEKNDQNIKYKILQTLKGKSYINIFLLDNVSTSFFITL